MIFRCSELISGQPELIVVSQKKDSFSSNQKAKDTFLTCIISHQYQLWWVEFFKIHDNNLTGHLGLCDEDPTFGADPDQITIMADCEKVQCECCISGQHGCSDGP